MTHTERSITRIYYTTYPGMTPLIIARLLGVSVEEVKEYINEIEGIG